MLNKSVWSSWRLTPEYLVARNIESIGTYIFFIGKNCLWIRDTGWKLGTPLPHTRRRGWRRVDFLRFTRSKSAEVSSEFRGHRFHVGLLITPPLTLKFLGENAGFLSTIVIKYREREKHLIDFTKVMAKSSNISMLHPYIQTWRGGGLWYVLPSDTFC